MLVVTATVSANLAASAELTACSDTTTATSTATSADAGADVLAPDGGPTLPDAALAADDAGCVVAASADPFCRSLSCPGKGCNPSAACQDARLGDCDVITATSSEALKAANAECAATADCKSLTATDECLFSKLSAAARTPAQTKLAADYCKRCGADAGDAGASCEADFYARSSFLGLTLLFYSDAVLDEIAAQCTGCGSALTDCAVPLADKKLPLRPAACK